MQRRILTGLLALVVATMFVAGCGGDPPVHYDFDTMADYADYRAFNFLMDRGTAEANPDDARVKRAVVMELTGRGYLQGGNGPMMLISHKVTYQDGKEWLQLEFVDESSSRRLWTGSTELKDMAGTPQEQDAAMQKNVTRLLSYFPPPKD